MQVVHIVAVLGVIGALLLLSANTNLEGQQNLRDNSLRVDAASSAGAYRAWAMGQARAGVPETPVPEYSNRAVRSALHAAATTPPFADGTKVAVAVAPRTKACAPGCEQNGVCNSELGRCDCPPYVGGDDCSKPLLPACAAAVGLTTVAPAPCVIDTLSLGAPVSRECLMGCEAIGLMVVGDGVGVVVGNPLGRVNGK